MAQLKNTSGVVIFEGAIAEQGAATGDVLTVNADGTVTPAPLPAPPVVVENEQRSGDAVTIGDQTNDLLTWDTHVAGAALMTITGSASASMPQVVDDGVYAITVDVFANTDMTVGGFFIVSLGLGSSGAGMVAQSPAATAAASKPRADAGITWYLVAGDTVTVSLRNSDGAQSIDFKIFAAFIQRITGTA